MKPTINLYNLGLWIYLECLYKNVRFDEKRHDAIKDCILKDFQRGGVYKSYNINGTRNKC